ncbi:MAG TPA: LysM domain-containing protein [Arenimonas sp.]|nr:LysM domain-containing protein [Arenimonas sp.]
MRKLLVALTIGASFLLAQPVLSDVLRTDHPEQYVVVKGDTLWDISARFLEKPWLWPQIWKKNPQVQNPDLIYPGDIIRLTYIDGKPYLTVNEAPNTNQAPVGAIDVDLYSRPFLKDLRVVSSYKNLPYILGNEESHLLGSSGNEVFVRGLKGVAAGEKVEIFRASMHFARSYKGSAQRTATSILDKRGDRLFLDGESFWKGTHTSPDSKDYIGTELIRVAVGHVVSFSGEMARVKVDEASREINVGDRVAPSAGTDYDPYYFPSAGPDIGTDNRIMAVRDGYIAGSRSIVALPVGSKQGVRNGNTYSIWSPGDEVPDRIGNRAEMAAQLDQVKMPNEYVGTLMVFRTFENVSYAVVMMGARPVHVGDYLKHPDAR